jgi:Protein of unknown function (DUF3110)
MRVFVLLFNARTENEGIHTLKVGDRNVVLMFESEDDATRYGLMLEAQDFSSPVVEAFDSEEIEDFCSDAAYECKIVPEGTLELPPESNVEDTDWQAEGTRPADREALPEGYRPSRSDEADEPTEFSDSELNQLRRRLEGLL